MLFPESAKSAIASVLYDKVVTVLETIKGYDSEGGAVKNQVTTKGTLKCSVRFINYDGALSEKGLLKDADIQIKCADATSVTLNDLIEYQNEKFTVVSILPYDSHTTILAKRWSE